jgi:hypothetical protein
MPRPRSPEGKNENLCVRVSETLLAEIDAARGERSRSDWGRDAFLAALGHPPGYAGTVHGIKIISDERMPPGTAALVSRGLDGVAVSAFSLGAGEPEPGQDAGLCPHPKSARLKGRCTRCRTFVGFA